MHERWTNDAWPLGEWVWISANVCALCGDTLAYEMNTLLHVPFIRVCKWTKFVQLTHRWTVIRWNVVRNAFEQWFFSENFFPIFYFIDQQININANQFQNETEEKRKKFRQNRKFSILIFAYIGNVKIIWSVLVGEYMQTFSVSCQRRRIQRFGVVVQKTDAATEIEVVAAVSTPNQVSHTHTHRDWKGKRRVIWPLLVRRHVHVSWYVSCQIV